MPEKNKCVIVDWNDISRLTKFFIVHDLATVTMKNWVSSLHTTFNKYDFSG